ncbi:MAG: 2OG-Fe(II) oxygenase [Flavobacteriaceae bacterium]|nr:2OG-Fe(II) oxygenase [Flavobacteriaceae bacterium]
MEYTRVEIASLIISKLQQEKLQLKKQFAESKSQIGFFYVDNVLPEKLAKQIFEKFPSLENTTLRKSLKEYKHIAYQMDKYNPLLEESIYAFQEESVVKLIQEICGLTSIFTDKSLYAGGLSLMKKDNFLNPHLDNSHDKERKHWRVLNLLYYVTPNWEGSFGGNIELWPDGLQKDPITITSKFNRLVVMATHQNSWHSVNKVLTDNIRCCVSNYYYSEKPLLKTDTFHVTSFKGRPTQKLRNLVLKLDNTLRMGIRKLFKKGVRENPHQYKNK